MRTPQIIKRAALQLTLLCAPQPSLLQTRFCGMDCAERIRKHAAGRAADAEARAIKAASERARREAERLLLLVVLPPLELVAVEQRRWAQQ